MNPIWLVLGAYVLGSVPFGLLVGKWKGVNIREHGSGNIGATNVGRVLGRKFGLGVFFLDFCKGLVAVTLVAGLAAVQAPESMPWVRMACLVGAVAGHNWSVFLGLKGGKGVATSAGGVLGLLPASALVGAVIFFVVVWWSGYVSLGSILAAISVPIFLPLLVHPVPVAYWVLSILLAGVVIWRHRPNIQRLRSGNESRVGWARKRRNQ